MQLNRNQMTMAIIGGVALVAVAAFAYLAYDAVSEREEAEMTLAAQTSAYQKAKGAVAGKEAAAEVDANTARLREWIDRAYGEAAALGSAVEISEADFDNRRKTEFQQMMLANVTSFQKRKILPEDVAAAYAVFPDFKDYLGGSLPDRPAMIREWDDICLFARTIADAKCDSLVSVLVVPEEPKAEESRRGGVKAEPKKASPIDSRTYVVTFMAGPGALVEVLNGFAKANRFVSVDELRFAQEPDPLVSILAGPDRKDEEGGGRGGRRSRRSRRGEQQAEAAAQEGEAAEKALTGKVTDPGDPLLCTPFRVTMRISTLTVRVDGKEAK